MTCANCGHPAHEDPCKAEPIVNGYVMACHCRNPYVLPGPGERPVFGVHRLPADERRTAPWAATGAEVAAIVKSGHVDSEAPARLGGTDAREVDP